MHFYPPGRVAYPALPRDSIPEARITKRKINDALRLKLEAINPVIKKGRTASIAQTKRKGLKILVSVVRFRPGPPRFNLKHPSLATGVFCFKRKRKNNLRLSHFPLMLFPLLSNV